MGDDRWRNIGAGWGPQVRGQSQKCMFDLLIYKIFIAYVKMYLFYSWTIVVYGSVTLG